MKLYFIQRLPVQAVWNYLKSFRTSCPVSNPFFIGVCFAKSRLTLTFLSSGAECLPLDLQRKTNFFLQNFVKSCPVIEIIVLGKK